MTPEEEAMIQRGIEVLGATVIAATFLRDLAAARARLLGGVPNSTRNIDGAKMARAIGEMTPPVPPEREA
jgi:hypothetical protein